MFKCDQFSANLYQVIVILAIIGMNIFAFIETGKYNETLIGALIGVCVGIPVPGVNKESEKK